jgi:hypothetical protein
MEREETERDRKREETREERNRLKGGKERGALAGRTKMKKGEADKVVKKDGRRERRSKLHTTGQRGQRRLGAKNTFSGVKTKEKDGLGWKKKEKKKKEKEISGLFLIWASKPKSPS